jgi:hypothetical protein
MSLVSLDYVKGRWAYSELLSPSFGHLYGGVEWLKEKAARGLPFESLTQEEIAVLIFLFNGVRGGYFNPYLTGANKFSLAHWTKEELGAVCVIPCFLVEFGLELMTFREWVETPPTHELSKNDPRQELSNPAPFAQEHPVTLGRYRGSSFLLDGYHRACRFWGKNEPAAKFVIYLPVGQSRNRGDE